MPAKTAEDLRELEEKYGIKFEENSSVSPYRVFEQDFSSVLDKEWSADHKLLKEFPNDVDGFIIPILSSKECLELIRQTEQIQYGPTGFPKSYRSNSRIIVNDPKMAQLLYKRIRKIAPSSITKGAGANATKWDICGLNERFRYCRYLKRQHFDRHCDAKFTRRSNEISFYTVNIYLNDYEKEFTGGKTNFYNFEESQRKFSKYFEVVPVAGLALIFNHTTQNYLHSGERLESGVKYILRTDIMYRKFDPAKEKHFKKKLENEAKKAEKEREVRQEGAKQVSNLVSDIAVETAAKRAEEEAKEAAAAAAEGAQAGEVASVEPVEAVEPADGWVNGLGLESVDPQDTQAADGTDAAADAAEDEKDENEASNGMEDMLDEIKDDADDAAGAGTGAADDPGLSAIAHLVSGTNENMGDIAADAVANEANEAKDAKDGEDAKDANDAENGENTENNEKLANADGNFSGVKDDDEQQAQQPQQEQQQAQQLPQLDTTQMQQEQMQQMQQMDPQTQQQMLEMQQMQMQQQAQMQQMQEQMYQMQNYSNYASPQALSPNLSPRSYQMQYQMQFPTDQQYAQQYGTEMYQMDPAMYEQMYQMQQMQQWQQMQQMQMQQNQSMHTLQQPEQQQGRALSPRQSQNMLKHYQDLEKKRKDGTITKVEKETLKMIAAMIHMDATDGGKEETKEKKKRGLFRRKK